LQEGSFADKFPRARAIGRQVALKLSLFNSAGGQRGNYANFVDGPNTFTIDPGLTVIELAELEKFEDLRGILFFAMVHLITQFFTDPIRFYARKFIFFDEVWAVDDLPETAKQTNRIIRTSRNNGVSATFISQLNEDFNTTMGQVIRKIAGMTLFLKQESSELDDVRRLFHLSPVEVDVLRFAQKHQGWSSGFLRLTDEACVIVRIVSDRYADLQMSQDHQLARRREAALAKAEGDVHEAFAALLEEGSYAR
jgi:type IV secretory pathway VirB4 component